MNVVKAYFLSMNRETLVLGIIMVVYCLALVISHSPIFKRCDSEKSGKKTPLMLVWNILCFVPLVLCGIHFAGHYLKGLLLYTLKLYMPMYLGAVLMALFPLFARRKRFVIAKVSSCVLTSLGVCVSMVFLLVTDWLVIIGNGTHMGYVKSFELLTDEMEKHYVMNEWKGIDYDEIKAQLLPEIAEAEKNQDEEAFYFALLKYINHFHDGHVRIEPNNARAAEVYKAAYSRLEGNDFGFSLITLSSGETIAVLVEEGCEAMRYGITDGTVITRWNGVPIDEAISAAEIITLERAPVAANMEFGKPLRFAGTGGESVEVSFIGSDGAEKNVRVKSVGSYSERLQYAEECLFNTMHLPSRDEIAAMSEEELSAFFSELTASNENFRSEMITEDCGYLVINSEEINVIKDTAAQIKGAYPEVTQLVDEKLSELKAQGMKKLVIDTRNNGGGFEVIINAVVTLFTDKEIPMGTDMYIPYTGGEMREINTNVIPVNGKWADLPVVVLTNSQ